MRYFGKLAKDIVSGFTGICIGKCLHLSGCTNYLLAPKVKENGKLRSGLYFSAERIEIIGEGIKVDEAKSGENSDTTELGRLGRDKITKFEGYIVAKVLNLYGSNSLALEPKAKDGECKGVKVFDEGRIQLIEGESVSVEEVQSTKPGGIDIPVPDNRAF